MIISKTIGAIVGVALGISVGWSALDYTPCSNFTITPVSSVVHAGEQIVLHFVGKRDVGACQVFIDYTINDGAGTQVYSWRRDVRQTGAPGPIDVKIPLPLNPGAAPGDGHVGVVVSYIKNPVQAVLYKIFGWSAALPPFDMDVKILPPKKDDAT